ncbi:MAG: hypothetical protein KDK71_05700, partial [Chlamydiia bacterium]|nr:hypothetical protein [Chlamydiia bacterium]
LTLSLSIKEAHKTHCEPQNPEDLEKSFALKMSNTVNADNILYSIFNKTLSFLTPEKQETPLPLQPAESLKKNGDEAIEAMFNTITDTVTTKYFQPLIGKMQREARIEDPSPEVKPIVHWLLNLIAPFANTTITKLEKFLAQFSMTRITLTLHHVASELLDCCLAMKKATGDHGNPMNNSWVMPNVENDPRVQQLEELNINREDAKQILDYSAKYTSGANASDVLANLKSTYADVIGNQDLEKRQIGESANKLQQAFPTLKPLIEDPQLTDSNTLFALLASQITSSTQEASFFSHATVLGIPHLVKNRGPEVAQRILDRVSSTGFISTSITKLLITSSLTLTTDNETWKELLPFLQLVYSSMTEEDQKYIRTHLSYLYSGEQLKTRIEELQSEIPQDKRPPIYDTLQKVLDEETQLSGYLAMLQPHIEDAKIQEMHKDLTRQLELKQFEKAKALVLFYVNEKLFKANFDPTGYLIQVITKIVEGAFDLLQYQAVVKHLIFTAIDFLCKEPESIKDVQNGHTPSMFEIMEAYKHNERLESKALEVAQAYNNEWDLSSFLVTGAKNFLDLAGFNIWTPLRNKFNENLRLTSANFAHLVTKQITDAGTDPSSLSAVIIEAMTEFVFDPRVESPTPQ